MFKINLVPEVQEKKLKIRKINTYSTLFGIGLCAVCGTALLIVGGIDIAKKTTLAGTNKKIEAVKEESKEYEELEKTVISLEQGLAGIKQIADGKNSWTQLLPHIEKATPSDVKYTSLKVSTGQIEGSIEASSVDSLAKLIESYKNYQVIVLSGPGVEGDILNITIDSSAPSPVTVKSSARWLYAVNIDPITDHEFKIASKNSEDILIKYDSKSKAVSSDTGSVTAEVKSLFSNVETKQYSKNENQKVLFEVKYNFDAGALW